MFDDNYEIENKGFPLVTYFKEISNVTPPQIFTQMHYHSDFEILYIVSGKAKMVVNTECFTAKKGSLILINPYDVHYGEIVGEELSYYCIDFDAKLLLEKDETKYVNHIENFDCESYVREIYDAYENEKAGWKMKAKGNLLILFSNLEEFALDLIENKENEFAKRVINYIEENYMKSITSKDAAYTLSYNHSYFCRLFRKNFSLRFSEYLSLFRIKIAKELLKKESVSSTAMKCGFSSISYFSVEFKKICAMSPCEYQKHYKI